MESIAVTKPGMGVLSQERLLLSPFGALAQAFSQEILDRTRKEEGRWSYVPLDLLEEGEESQTAPAVPPVIQVDLHLVLEALRREKGESEQRRATERIVERILQIREVRDRPAAQSPARPRLEERPSASPMGVLRQNISQTLVQENRFGPFLPLGVGPQHVSQQGALLLQVVAHCDWKKTHRPSHPFPRGGEAAGSPSIRRRSCR